MPIRERGGDKQKRPSVCGRGRPCITYLNWLFSIFFTIAITAYTFPSTHFLLRSTWNAFFFFIFTAVKGLEKSVIIGDNPEYLAKMGEWLKPVTHSDRYWKLCWRATQHGWGVSPFHANTFHANCDGKGPTVTIVKVFSNIFGGFTSKSWGEWQ